ncbi:MAG TPA: glycosyltransferase [Myxococcales bacterium]|nr:glycosyltransferase [Myxococcales bacterium]
MSPRILHVLSQRPSLTGSGITLDVLVRHAAKHGYEQRVVVGTPASDPHPEVGDLAAEFIHPLHFETGALPFPVPGMSDVMPYRSSVWSRMSAEELALYRRAWTKHLLKVTAEFKPELIHCHHAWLLGGMMKSLFPDTPVITHSHATGLRQMALCPELAPQIKAEITQNNAFCALHQDHAAGLIETLGVSPQNVHVVGAGYRSDIFHCNDRKIEPLSLVYAGKYSHAKGLPQLLDSVEILLKKHPQLVLHVAGDGAGEEAEALRSRMKGMSPNVVMYGMLNQRQLGALLRRCGVFVLPSFYEGLPLVLVEALASGCRLVCTALPGVCKELAFYLGMVLELVELPELIGPDTPNPSHLPAFVERLTNSLEQALGREALQNPQQSMPETLAYFSWDASWQRVETLWKQLLNNPKL